METGREPIHQIEVPDWLRKIVPAKFGVEIVNSNFGQVLVISDQLSNRHVDTMFDGIHAGNASIVDAVVVAISR